MRRNGISIMAGLIGLIKPLMLPMIAAITLGVVGFLCAIGISIAGGYAITSLMDFTDTSLKTIFVLIAICAVMRGILHYAEQAFNHYIAFKLLAIIRRQVFDALRRLSPAKLEGKRKGDLVSLITSDIELLEVFYAHTVSPIAIAIITSIIMVFILAQYHIVFAIIGAIGYFVVGAVLPILLGKAGGPKGMKYREDFATLNSKVYDSLRGIDEILQYDYSVEKYSEIEDSQESLNTSAASLRTIEGIQRGITGSAILVFSIIMMVVSIIMYDDYMVNFDGVLMPTLIMMSSFGPVVALSNLSNNLNQTLASGERVLNILEEEPLVKDVVGEKLARFGDIKVNDLDFAYEKEKILEGINLDLKEGKILGLLGKSGSGKSTLLKLLMRFWQRDSGLISINNVDIEHINTVNLRDMQSYVTQETWLFNDTIENNIAIAKLDATEKEIEMAARKAGIHDFIASLEKGYKTKVGELGDSLSGGERQRIGLARAFVHKAPMMLLDEPTSNLDAMNESYILNSIDEEAKDKTIILVSHRESTMSIVDEVYKIESGRMS